MRKTLFALFCAFVLASCGGGSDARTSQEESQNDVVSDPSDFSGSYTRKDDNCSYYQPDEFNIDQNNTNLQLFITDPGQTGMEQGDLFYGSLDESDGRFYADFTNELLCEGTYIVDADDKESVESNVGLKTEIGDIIVVCTDYDSADELCQTIYRKD